MSDPHQLDEDHRPTTPEERSHAKNSANPASGVALFKKGDSAWLEIGKRAIGVTIVKKLKEGGKYYYQVTDQSGQLYKGGKPVSQEDLEPR